MLMFMDLSVNRDEARTRMSYACNRIIYENEYTCFTTVLTTNRLYSHIQTQMHYITTNVLKANN